jgi:hypothetical protein
VSVCVRDREIERERERERERESRLYAEEAFYLHEKISKKNPLHPHTHTH